MHAQSKKKPKRSPRRFINRRFLLWTLVILGLIGAAGFGYFHLQTRRLADNCLRQATKFEEAEEWKRAAEMLRYYLDIRPEDHAARRRLAENFARGAQGPDQSRRAVDLYEQALDKVTSPAERIELQREIATFEMEHGMFAAAERRAKILGNDPAGLRIAALSIVALSRGGGAEGQQSALLAVERALDARPDDAELATLAAELALRLPDDTGTAKASEIMDRLVAQPSPESATERRLARFEFRQRNNLPGAEEDLQAALQADPDHPRVLLAAGLRILQQLSPDSESAPQGASADQDQLQQAIEYLQQSATAEPKNGRAFWGWGQALWLEQRREEACATWRQGLETAEENRLGLYERLAFAELEQNHVDQADDYFNQLARELTRMQLTSASGNSSYIAALRLRTRLGKAQVATESGRPEEAIEILRDIAEISQESITDAERSSVASALLMLARAQQLVQRPQEAIDLYQRLADVLPESNAAIQLVAASIRATGDRQQTMEAYREGLEKADIGPDFVAEAAESMLAHQVEMPPTERVWTEFESTLQRLENESPTAWQLPLLRAGHALATGVAPSEVLEMLRQAEDPPPNEPRFWQALSQRYLDLDSFQDALRASEHASVPEWFRLRVLVLGRRYPLAAPAISELVSQASEAERPDALRRASDLHLLGGNLPAARAALDSLHALRPQDIGVLSRLAEVALRQQDLQAVASCEEKLKAIEKETGVLWRHYRAGRLLATESELTPQQQEELKDLTAAVITQRPNWAAAHAQQAEAFARLDQVDDAIEAFRRSIQLGERRVAVFEQLIGLLNDQQQYEEAEQYLRQVAQYVPYSSIMSLASSSVAEALDRAPQRWRRQRAELLAWFGGTSNLASAEDLLAPLVEAEQAELGDRILLAKLQEAQGKLEAADEQLAAVRQADPASRVGLIESIGFCLRHDRLDQADALLDQLAQLLEEVPHEERSALVALRAQWLFASEQASQIKDLVRTYVEAADGADETRQQQLRNFAAIVLARTEQFEDAETWLRESMLHATPENRNAAILSLAILFARQNRHHEANQLLQDEGQPNSSLEQLSWHLKVLSTGEPAADAFAALEPLIGKVLAEDDQNLQAVYLSSWFRVLQGKPEVALELLQEADRQQSGNALTMNNIAAVMAKIPGRHEEALEYIARALEVVDPAQPRLLSSIHDTRGVILLQQEEFEEALASFKKATSFRPVDPRAVLHLAATHQKLGALEEARQAWNVARRLGVQTHDMLSSLDSELIDSLDEEFSSLPVAE